MMRATVLALALALAVPAWGGGFSALLDSVVEAYGGPRAAARLESFRAEAEITARMRGMRGRMVREFLAPDRLRVEITYPRSTEVRVLNGDRGWRGDAGRLQRVEGLPLLAMRYQLLRSAVPWVFTAHRRLLEDRGTRRRNGVDYRLVGLPWSMGLDLVYWIDPVTRRVDLVEGTLRARGGAAPFATEYSDFRRVDGVLVPFHEENYASGRHTGTTRLVSVRFGTQGLGPFDPTRDAGGHRYY
ncbi:hypothetical protein [Deferrisoma camini]|uniref:hypothetical protein n=1 Tax=Deferrisoma camini TaxID=1035120 RepID=UPI0004B7810F|nr:hypothetical protein [Deferrisoma camini]